MYSRCIIKIVLISLWNFSSTLSLSPIWINWILLSLDNSFGEYTMLWLVLKDVIRVTVQSYTLINIILRIFGIVNHRDNRFESKSFVSSSNETFLHESISTNAMKWISLLLPIFENSQSRANMNGHMIKEKMEIRKKKKEKNEKLSTTSFVAAPCGTHTRVEMGPACFFPRVTPLVAIRILCLSSRYLFTRLSLQDRSNNQSLCVRRNLRRSLVHHAGFILIRRGNGCRVERRPAAPKILNIHN